MTKLEDGVDGFEWAPDSKTIAFTTKDPLSKAQKDRVERYGEYTVIDGDERMTHLWTVDVTAAPVAAPAKDAKEKLRLRVRLLRLLRLACRRRIG